MHPRLLAPLVLSVVLSGCPRAGVNAGASGTDSPADAERQQLAAEVRALSAEAEALLRAQDLLVWQYWTEGGRADIPGTYGGKDALFSLESIRKIDRLRQLTEDPRELRAMTALQSHFAGEYLARALSELNEAAANLEASLTYTVNRSEVRYRDLERLLASEPSAVRRRALYTGATPVLERLNQTLRRKEERTQALVRELGYPSYEAFGAELRQADFTRLGLLAEEILEVTQEPYLAVMERLAQRELQLPFARLTRADLPRLFRPGEVDASFPQESQLRRVQATVAGMGIDLGALPGLRLDTRELPSKSPRPLALAVKVPTDVRLSVKPSPGVLAASNLLHEVGHALHAVFTKEPRFELAKLGNPTLSEAYGALLEDLVVDPVWLEEHAGLSGEARAQHLAAAGAHKLFLLRRTAGRLLYQLQLHRPGASDGRALYAALLARTDGMPVTAADEARYLVEQEEFYSSADTLRAWLLAAQLQAQLKARFGPAWWRRPEAGVFLKSLWRHGNALSAREIAIAAGERAIYPDSLLARLGATLEAPIELKGRSAPAAPPAQPKAPAPTEAPDAGAR